MGKNSAKKGKKAKNLAGKNNQGSTGAVKGNTGTNQGPAKPAPKVVTDLSDIAVLVAPEAPIPQRAPRVAREVPPTPPVVAIAPDLGDQKFGYVMSTSYNTEGKAKWTKVLVESGGGYDSILYHHPAVVLEPGTLIKFTPGEYAGRMTVTNPVIQERNNEVTRLFKQVIDSRIAATFEEISMESLAQTYLSVNHVGKDEKDRFQNFLASQGILEVVALLPNGRIMVKK